MKKLLFFFVFCYSIFLSAQNVTLFEQFNGRLDFTAFGNTLNEFPNNGPGANCTLLPSSSATLNLTSGQTFVSAHLYWGSIGTGDFDVELNGTPITAQRIFSHTFNGLPYFAAYTNITNLVAATGNGVYTFSELDVSSIINNYCGTDFGGWAVYIIYADPSLNLNQISLFDGLESVSASNQSLAITLMNIDVTTDELSKIGFLAWEGEESIANNETLLINGILIDNPPLNPGNNAFNGTNSYTGSGLNYNMDLDFYDLVGIVQPGDTSVLINLTSSQDFVMVNNIITSVNSEIPDATIEIDNIGVLCQNNNMDVDYTVYNVNSTAPLALNTPIAFYADAVLIGQTQTVADIPIGGSESGSITLNIPVGTPNLFNLRAVVDDIGNGTGVVAETNEMNNEWIEMIDLSLAGIFLGNNIEACEGSAVILDTGLTDPPFDIQWFLFGVPIPGAINPTLTVTADGLYSVEAQDGICFVPSNQVLVHFNPQPIANPPVDLFQCDFGTTSGVFDLTQNDANVLGTQNPALFNIKYYETLLDSQNDTNAIIGPAVHLIVPPSPQTIYVRIEDLSGTCFALEDFKIFFSRAIAGIVPVTFNLCDNDMDGGEFIDLFVQFNSFVLDGEPSSSYNITYHNSQSDADLDINPLPNPYFVTAPSEIVYIRLENADDSTCFDSTQNVNIIIDTPPTINSTPPTLVLCDPNNDGFAEFDLTVQSNVITLGDPTLTVTYHGTLLDAENGLLPLPNPYTNDDIYLDAPITDITDPLYGTGGVWARVVSSVSSCNAVVPFALEVRFAPVATTPADPLRICDDTVPDGFTFFDLTVAEPEVLGTLNPTEFDFYYYENLADATLAGDSALTAPDFSAAIPTPTAFLNSTNPQDIYILVVGNATSTIPPNPNSGEGCYDIVVLTLIVDPIPEDLGPFEMNLCDDDLNGSTLFDEISTFDLTSQDVLVNGGNPTILVQWFETPADEVADNPIADPTMYQNLATPQTIIGRATSEFGCTNLITLTLTVLPNPNPKTDPSPLELCDDDDDGLVAGFDLSLRDVEIIDGELDVSVLYYEDLSVAMAGLPGTEIISPYTNVVPFSQTVYARVTKDVPPNVLPCYTIVELVLNVIDLPDIPDANFQDPFIGCDESGNGQAIFDLTLQDPSVLGIQNPTDFVLPITYYETQADADAATNAIAPANAFLSGGQTIWVRLESLITGCVRITQFEIEVGIFPTIGVGDDLYLCDDDINGSALDDGLSTFDLTVNTPLIDLGDTSLTVVYYATASDQANNIPITTPEAYQNILSPQQQIFVSGVSTQGCQAISTFFIHVEPNPVPNPDPSPLELCDDDDDGLVAGFDLTLRDNEIINGEPGVSILYYENLAFAIAGTAGTEIISPYTNVIPDSQIVYARVTRDVPPGILACYTIVELELIVIPKPDMPDANFQDPFISCDDNGDGMAIFDLSLQDSSVVGVQNPTDFVSPITYYESQADADAGTNAIVTPTSFPSTGQTIWVRLESLITGCYRVSQFEIEVGLFPIIGLGDSLVLCDDEINGSTPDDGFSTFDLTVNTSLINLGDTSLTVVYYASASDQTNNIPIINPDAYQNVDTPLQIIYVSVFSDQGCEATNEFTLIVEPNPTPVSPTPLIACDVNNDGIAEFTLTDKDAEIVDSVANLSVSYHETLIDAENNAFALVSPYTNIVANSQIVYARVSFDVPPTTQGCFAIVELELRTSPTPDIPSDLPDLLLCDDDGFAVFDLTQQEPLIYGIQDPMAFTLTYHLTLIDAQTATNAIATPDSFTNTITPEQTIYVRLTDDESGCFKVGEFLIKVSLGPTVNQPDPLTVCDDLGEPNDGFAAFDLTLKNDEITGAVPGVGVRYYETLIDAQDDTNRIDPETAYVNISNPQVLYVRVIDGNTECFDTSVTLTIRVVANPTPVSPEAIEMCDNNNPGDGMEIFDLTQRESDILNGETWDIAYYESFAEALAGDITTAIPTPTAYTNINPGSQIVYVRVTIDMADPESCFEIVELELVVYPIPDDTAVIEPFEICEIGSNGVAVFDLTTKILEILNGQDPLLFTVTFYESSADALANTNPIVNPSTYQNITNPQSIFTGIQNIGTDCYIGGVQFFDISALEGAAATTPAGPYIVCDNSEPSDGIADITLYNLPGDPDPDPSAAALEAEILGGQTFPPYELLFFETLLEADAGDPTTSLPNVYTNVINPQVIYARVTNTDTGCYEIVEVILKVEQLPEIALDEEYRLCIDANGNPIPEEEGAISPPVIDTGLDPSLFDIVWEYPGGTAFGPAIIAIEGGNYTVTYTEIATGCSATVSTTVTVSQPPVTYEAVLVNGAFSDNNVVQATADGMGTYVFQLDNGEFMESGTFENVSSGVHTVTIKDANGCGSVTINIGVIDYPRFVTPNQDGFHDTWNIIGISEFDPTAKIYIFDRHGKLLKQVSPLGAGWNGTYNGNPLPSSDYWFLVEYNEDDMQKEFRGHFTLKR